MPNNKVIPLDFSNAVEQMAWPEVQRKPLLPLFEAVHNSMHSIRQAKRENGLILVKINRKEDDLDPKQITSITIKDNGIGFTADNIKSFGKLFSSYKKKDFNCKGIGRLAYFALFYNVNIYSQFHAEGKAYHYGKNVNEHNFHELSSDEPKIAIESNGWTTVEFSNPNQGRLHLLKIPQQTIRRDLLNHFLPSLLSTQNIQITVLDDGEYQLDQNSNDVSHDTPIHLEGSRFDIYHLKNKTPHNSSHKIILSADGRSVKEYGLSFLPKGKIGVDDDKYFLNTVVVSEYLDKKLNALRSDFDIPKSKILDYECITLDELYKSVSESSKKHSQSSIKHFENVLDSFIVNTLEELPHLTFLKDDAAIKNELKLGDDQETVTNVFVKRFAEKQVESINYVKSITKKYEESNIPNFDEFQSESLVRLQEGMKINHAPLVSYITYRDFVLSLFEKLLERRDDQKYQPEQVLHNLLFPTKAVSMDYIAGYFKHNLWIIDDRFSIYDFITSELPEYKAFDSEYDKNDKRYDIFATYADPQGTEHNVFVIELKRTCLALSEANDPISQIKNYVQRMINRSIKRHNGTRINITDSTQFFGLVLCDIHSNYFMDFLIDGHNLKKRPDGRSYHAVLLNDRLFLEVTNYENLLYISKARNKVFIDKLKGTTPPPG